MNNPEWIRLSFFLSVLVICALWEWAAPRKVLTQRKSTRWLNNLGIVGLNSLCLALLMPVLAVETAILAQGSEIGLFNHVALPIGVELVLSVLLLDLAIYAQHILFHRAPLLWRLHRMHHADQDIDVTTGSRFHPIEILLSMGIKIALVILLGLDPLSVVVFEIVLNASAMFNHSNGWMPLKWDTGLRKLVVTPDMHRVHHSVIERETHSNFGFFLSIWDRLFGTYRSQPEQGHQGVTIGLPLFRSEREQWLDKMLTQPFRNHE
ncbi:MULTISPECIES: sterol desaturase family protein [unclassified Vibrio]|uniref:sterol desaturase family protein n=1 Tax=unclassified Vibrio TaxID=2614977 RepID=UPI00136150C8|nr:MULTISPECIES: sterol desaturase family protein [unclassified Vibrio]NAW60149.1 sterol desaturase family protein [Vibrio sp. V36_P2S2PM302]NAX26328.1 sterol desaturase family protein [Vibrio sp. V38_P2S17PM301]NAX32041.1 sterol desaturase family protein [Vibrio sp. V37_P2S8PM304]